MKNKIIKILWKWSIEGKIDQYSYEDMATELTEMVAKNLHKPIANGSFCVNHGERTYNEETGIVYCSLCKKPC